MYINTRKSNNFERINEKTLNIVEIISMTINVTDIIDVIDHNCHKS